MIFSKSYAENQEFWRRINSPIFDSEEFQNCSVLIGNFSKIGRTFKQKCIRSYFLIKDLLLYSDVGQNNTIKGFVQLNRVYCQFQENCGVFQIILSNNGYQITLNTDDLQQYKLWQDALSKCCILRDFEQNYELGAQIGQGSFSTVHQCYNKNGELYAVKIIKKQTIKQFLKNKGFEEQLLTEIQALRMFNHPNMLKLYKVYENTKNIYLLTEYINGPELISISASKKIYKADEVKVLIYSLLLAIEQMHSQKIMHRDIKPQNILLNENDITKPILIDFGLAASTQSKSIPFPQCGSPGYSAPEILKYDESKKLYNQQCDMFSLGITLFVVLYGYNPFKASDLKQTLKKNTEAYFEIPHSKYPKQLEDLISQMTKKYPKDRINITDALNHQFFTTPFFCQLQLPKQVVSKQFHDILCKGDLNIQMHNSMEINHPENYTSQGASQVPQEDIIEQRKNTILSQPICRKSQELKQDISSQTRSSNDRDSNNQQNRHQSKTLQYQWKQECCDEYQLEMLDHDNNFVDKDHINQLKFSINNKLFQTSKKL